MRDQAYVAVHNRYTDGGGQGEVGVGDVMRIVERVRDVRPMGVEALVSKRDQLTIEGRPDRRGGQAGHECGLVRVVEIQNVREPRSPQ